MIKRTVTGLVLAAIVIGMLFLRQVNLIFFDMLVLLSIFICFGELIYLFRAHMTRASITLLVLFGVALYPVYYFLGGLFSVLLLGFATAFIMTIVQIFDQQTSFDTLKDFLFVLFYPTVMLCLIFDINHTGLEVGLVSILLFVAIACVTDTCALFTGVLFGRHKLCERISPKKTWEGSIGGLLGGVGASLGIWAIFPQTFETYFTMGVFPSIAVVSITAVIGSVLSQMGDLVASNLKRKMGIKDFSNLVPGHGGYLDRLDSITYSVVVVYVLLRIMGLVTV